MHFSQSPEYRVTALRSQIQALHQARQGSRRDDAAEKATLKRTFQYKAVGPDQNREQDFFLYELDASNKYYETMDNWLKANKALIDRRLVNTKEGIKRNETYVKFVHDAEKKLWQELANSLVWTVRIDGHLIPSGDRGLVDCLNF